MTNQAGSRNRNRNRGISASTIVQRREQAESADDGTDGRTS